MNDNPQFVYAPSTNMHECFHKYIEAQEIGNLLKIIVMEVRKFKLQIA